MKWYNYVFCFLAGIFLIHLVPHVLNGLSLKNVIGATVSLVGGCLFLWAGKFSFKKPWTIVLLLIGLATPLVIAAVHPHHVH